MTKDLENAREVFDWLVVNYLDKPTVPASVLGLCNIVRDELKKIDREIEGGWKDIITAPEGYGIRMKLTVGFENQYKTVIGERNNDGNRDYWWIHGEMGCQRATANYIGLPIAWKQLDEPATPPKGE